MVVHPNKGVDDDEIDEEDCISTDKCISLTEKLIKGLEQKSFISEPCIMWVHNIQEVLQKRSLNA
jgi:hypothetical protein